MFSSRRLLLSIIIISVLHLIQLISVSYGESETIIHRVWSSLRPPSYNVVATATVPPIYTNDDIDGDETIEKTDTRIVQLPRSPQDHLRNESSLTTQNFMPPRKTLVYGSPICIGRCIILQIFWSNSTSSVLGVKLPQLPTFPRPRETSKRGGQPNIS